MYVSVDSLPELTPEYQHAQQQAVQEAKVVYQFELVRQRPNDYVTILLWLALVGYLLWLGTLLDWLGMTVFTLFTFAL
ncbi:hypothetical protein ABS858_23840, partial [Vibrio neptunius]|uniref:hypothetical protein n=1 Tax=Vibrio neptunius TaxID=170651 RepID=UPI003314D873